MWMGAIFILLLTLLVYMPALKNDFVWDDYQYVYENNGIRSLNPQSLYWMLTSFHAANWHPLTWLSHSIDYALWGLDPLGHRLTNIIMHGLNTLLVFLLVIQLMMKGKKVNGRPSPSKMPRSITPQALIVAGITALLFGLHPLHVESVAWVAERKDLLCAFFVLLSIISYLAYTSSITKRYRWIWFTVCLLLFILALMSKPMAVTLPVILLLLDIYPLNRLVHTPFRNLSIIWEKIPFFILSIVSSIITIIAQHDWGIIGSLEQYHLNSRLLNALRSLVFYLEKMIVPSKLVPFYPFPSYIHWLDVPYLVSGVLVLAITGGCLWMAKSGRYLFLITWSYYVITLLPVIGIIQVGVQAAADRYTYLPSLSIFLLIGIGALCVFERVALIKHKSMLGGLVLLFICIFMFLGQLTVKQIRIWRNPEILWSYVINVFPGRVPLAHNNLGFVYEKKGGLDEAISQYKQALAIDPRHLDAYYNLGRAYTKKGMLNEAVSEYKRALVIKPHYAKAHNNLGNIYKKRGGLDEAISEYRKALTINPNYAEARTNLGGAYSNKGMFDEAIAECKKAIAINSNLTEPHTIIGVAYHKKGEFAKAISEYKRAMAIKPDYPLAHNNLALSYYLKGNYRLAIIHCDRAVELGYSVNPKLLELLKPYR